jgi:hypothetical protein
VPLSDVIRVSLGFVVPSASPSMNRIPDKRTILPALDYEAFGSTSATKHHDVADWKNQKHLVSKKCRQQAAADLRTVPGDNHVVCPDQRYLQAGQNMK